MRLVEAYDNLLTEGELENIREKWLKKFDDEHVVVLGSEIRDFNFYSDEFIKTIPTPKKYLNKYYTLINDSIDSHTLKSLMEDLLGYFQTWFELKKLGHIKEDIISIGSITALKTIVSEASNKRKEKEEEKKIDPIYEDSDWYVIKVNSTQASCKYGQGTRWCISATHDNRYDNYSKDNEWDIYFIINKKDNKVSPTYKLALLVSRKDPDTIQVYDSEDDRIQKIDYIRRFIPQIFEACIENTVDKISKSNSIEYIADIIEKEFVNYHPYTQINLDYDIDDPTSISVFYHHKNNSYLGCIVFIDFKSMKLTFEVVDLEGNGDSIDSVNVPIKILSERHLKQAFSDGFNELRGSEKIHSFVMKGIKKEKEIEKNKRREARLNISDEEYFANSGLYGDIDKNENTKVPINAFRKAITMLKTKNKVKITDLRRLVDPHLLSSHSVKPLLKSLYKFGLISLERNGINIFIVPTPKLIKSKIEDLI